MDKRQIFARDILQRSQPRRLEIVRFVSLKEKNNANQIIY